MSQKVWSGWAEGAFERVVPIFQKGYLYSGPDLLRSVLSLSECSRQ